MIVASADSTIRQRLTELLRQHELTVREISQSLRISEKEVYHHLGHVERSLGRGERLISRPARCLDCGFVFRKRTKHTPPGKCPVCRSEFISAPVYGRPGDIDEPGD